tara:strand:+ start:1481 stop:1915 length:435 start_codon:yes stop_codon:yes gene_type:complete
MAKQVIGIGTTANDGTGDQVRVAFDKANQNFTELYDRPEFVDDSVVYSKLGTEFTTSAVIAASDVDFSTAQIFTKTLTADTTFTFSNANVGMVKDLIITGSFVPTFPVGSKVVAGTYDGTVSNLIQVVVAGSGDYWLSISKAQV